MSRRLGQVGTVAVGARYVARNGCLTCKRFKSMATAQAWLDRVGAKDAQFFDYVRTEGGWSSRNVPPLPAGSPWAI